MYIAWNVYSIPPTFASFIAVVERYPGPKVLMALYAAMHGSVEPANAHAYHGSLDLYIYQALECLHLSPHSSFGERRQIHVVSSTRLTLSVPTHSRPR